MNYYSERNDRFVVRAFVADGDLEVEAGAGEDEVIYNVNAPVSINGGDGFDTVVAIGTEANDTFIITEDGIFGAGLSINLDGVEEAIEVDGLEGDDTFYVLSTRANTVSTIIGGLGSDTFNMVGDVTQRVVSLSLDGRSSIINHGSTSTDEDYNNLLIEGDTLFSTDIWINDPTLLTPTGQ